MQRIEAMSELAERYLKVKERVREACRKAGRDENSVKLVAVSKFHPIEAIVEVAELGQKEFGENYIQEALEKIAVRPDLCWHAIGPVQSKKAKEIIGKFSLIESLATESLLQELAKRTQNAGCTQDVLLQVNIGREEQKSGLLPEELLPFAQKVLEVPQLKLCGLMCLPPLDDNPEHTRPYFIQLRELKENLEKELGLALPHLSMGMSADFPTAIEEGATIIRVGTDIFGPRKTR